MELRSKTIDDSRLDAIIRQVGHERYADNLKLGGSNGYSLSRVTSRGYRTRFTLGVNRTSEKVGGERVTAPGVKLSASVYNQGRRCAAACWHAHRDVMQAIFEFDPDAVLVTALAIYHGAAGFEENFGDTFYHGAGSLMFSRTYGELCEC